MAQHKETSTVGNTVKFSTLGSEEKELIKASVKAQEVSYCPYSKFSVGAALRCDDGLLFTGCNVECAAYPIGICAERTAIVKAVSEGKQKYTALSISAKRPGDIFISPCGACRQFISEFSTDRDIVIYLSRPELDNILVTSIRELLPLSFSFIEKQT